ncbi:MAG: PstS family phosphate ABC transporter substrate-binding protein [Rhodocyclaceae bacterium]|nr:PstS family phosphate ABC transporter substrate-binding protein [Rhodocyclaceae bacterium]
MSVSTRLFHCLLCLPCLLPGNLGARPLVTVDGSSSVYPITEAAAEDFQNLRRRTIWVTVGISGTGGGFRKFCRGEIDIVDASRPVTDEEARRCHANGIDFFELPIALDALAVVVAHDNPLGEIGVAELRRIWEPAAQGRIMSWRELGKGLPDRPLALYGPGSDSGTFEYFTAAIVGRARASRGDYTASEDDNLLVTGVAADPSALGYFGLAYYLRNADRVRALAVRPPAGGDAILPTPDNVRAGRYQPLTRRLFIYVKQDAARRQAVRDFVDFYLEHAAELVDEARYVPLDADHYRLLRARFRAQSIPAGDGGGR